MARLPGFRSRNVSGAPRRKVCAPPASIQFLLLNLRHSHPPTVDIIKPRLSQNGQTALLGAASSRRRRRRRRPSLSLKRPVQLSPKPVLPPCQTQSPRAPLFESPRAQFLSIDQRNTRVPITTRRHTVSFPSYHHPHQAATSSSQYALST